MWRSRLHEDTGEIAHPVDNTVRKHSNESENGNRTIADCQEGTEVNLVTALGFYSMFFRVTHESRTKTRDGHSHQCRNVSGKVTN